MSLTEIGLDFDAREMELRTLYNPPGETLIAILVPRRPGQLDKRVFVRQLGEERYRELSIPHELSSIAGVAVCSDLPALFLNVFVYRDAARAAADFAGVARVFLPQGMIERLPSPVLVDTPQWQGPAIPTDLWIDDILAASADGQRLHVIAAIVVPTGETLHSAHAGRWLATFDVGDGSLKPLAEFPAMFA